MRHEVYNIDGVTWVRIPKKLAHNLFTANIPIIIAPCNIRLDSPYCRYAPFTATDLEHEYGATIPFNNFVNQFEWYNCQYNDMGKYAKFFVNQYDLTSYELTK